MKNYYKLQLTNSDSSYYSVHLMNDGVKVGFLLTSIGEEIDGEMYDLLTGERILEVDEYTVLPYLSYYKKQKAYPDDLIYLRNKICENKMRYDYYRNGLMHILECNKKKYQEFLEAEKELKELRKKKNESIL